MAERRSIILELGLFAVTLGVYAPFWFYTTSEELIRLTKRDANPLGWTLMFLIPGVNVFAIWLHATGVEALSKKSGGMGMGATFVFISWLIPPLAVALIQAELNIRAPARQKSKAAA